MHAGYLVLAHAAENLPPPWTGGRVFTAWQFDPWIAVPLILVAAAYVYGTHRLRARGDRWPVGRTVAFVGAGLGSIGVATMGSVGVYDDTLFWPHMVQHMILAMTTPVFLALGAPVTLALRTLPRRGRRALTRALHSRVAKVVTHPVFAFPAFISVLPLLYFTGWYELTLRNTYVHELTHVHFVLVGCLFFWPLLGVDPMPVRMPHIARFMTLLVSMPVHVIVGLSLMMSDQVVAADYYRSLGRHWGITPLQDQHIGGGILWAAADGVSLLYIIVVGIQWMRSDEREARRVDRQLDRAEARRASGFDEDDALTAYNAYLARLNGLDPATGLPAPRPGPPAPRQEPA